MMNNNNIKKEIVDICKLMAKGGLVAGTEGNVSGRDQDGRIFMTPSGYNKGDVNEDMLVELDLEGNLISGKFKPTSEKHMHLGFYKMRKKVMGVVHGHPVFSTAFASSGKNLPHNILPELVAIIGKIPIVPYGRPSSIKLANVLAPYVCNHNVFLLKNHGATAVGQSVRDAYHRLQVAESYAKTIWAAEALGGVQPLTSDQIEDLPKPCYD